MSPGFISTVVLPIYLIIETFAKVNGFLRISAGSGLAAYGLAARPEEPGRWILIAFGLLVALRGTARLIVEMIRSDSEAPAASR